MSTVAVMTLGICECFSSRLVPVGECSQDFLRYAGFDALVCVRMYLLAGKMCVIISLFALTIILPINLSGGSVEDDNTLSKMSMSNIDIGSPLL